MLAVLIRAKTEADTAGCVDLLLQVHRQDSYPLHLAPQEVPGFLAGEHEEAAWVAERDGRIVGHVALHCPPEDPTLTVAAGATGQPTDALALVSRLFVAPDLRRTGLGRVLLRHAAGQARAFGQRAVLDVGQALAPPIALYESEGWNRVGELHPALDDGTILDLWVYVSPESPDLRMV
jgi:GNAT superfamily N-acetyltransferase